MNQLNQCNYLHFEIKKKLTDELLSSCFLNLNTNIPNLKNLLKSINSKTIIKKNISYFSIKFSKKNNIYKKNIKDFILSQNLNFLHPIIKTNILNLFLRLKNIFNQKKIKKSYLEHWFEISIILFTTLKELNPSMITTNITSIPNHFNYLIKNKRKIILKKNTNIISLIFFKLISIKFKKKEKGITLQSSLNNLLNIFLIKPFFIKTISNVIKNQNTHININMIRLEAVFKNTDKMNLIYKLKKAGAINIEFQITFKYSNIYEKILLISQNSYIDLIKELIFKYTDSTNISTLYLENEKLNKKITLIAINNRKNSQICRIMEYFFQNKILRITPFENDLVEISKKNKCSKNSIKIKVINKWKIKNKK
jgi:hypothetical protein